MRPKARLLYPFDYPVLVFAVATLWIARSHGIQIRWGLFLDIRGELFLMLVGAPFTLAAVWYWKRSREAAPALEILRRFAASSWSHARDWRVWYEVVRTILAVHVCLVLVGHLKQTLPLINGHLYDDPLEHLDRWVNFGLSPRRVGLFFGAHPGLTRSIDVSYVLWYFIKAPVLLVFLFQPHPRTRWHFFTAYVLLWIVGWSACALVPTLGPVYTHPESFAGLHMPVARALQGELWKNYQLALQDPRHYSAVLFEGIAAFPSLHVGVVALYTIGLRRYGVFFWLMLAYTMCVQAGSVILGWHYALDGYAAMAMAAGIYYLTWRVQVRPARVRAGGPVAGVVELPGETSPEAAG